MNRCIKCGKEAQFMVGGNSYCEEDKNKLVKQEEPKDQDQGEAQESAGDRLAGNLGG